ncbi:alpha-1,3-mannosyl-glycoprotein 4-beta-N-acetylglucosaminyltransferase B [Trichonephila clavipes]|nr:alpha-1,3-mannosyl-glycoprotein 4-beta-N-acetylglucosaminyltransferase B [Trichonephila clavipes]
MDEMSCLCVFDTAINGTNDGLLLMLYSVQDDRRIGHIYRGVCAPGKPRNSGDFELRYPEIPGIVVQKDMCFNLKQQCYGEMYLFRSGNAEHPEDKFLNTSVEVLPVSYSEDQIYPKTKDGFLVVGHFKESTGVAEGNVSTTVGHVKVMRLYVHSESDRWAILSEDPTHQIQQWCTKLSHKGCEVVIGEAAEGFLLLSSGNFVFLTSGSGPHQTKSKQRQGFFFTLLLDNLREVACLSAEHFRDSSMDALRRTTAFGVGTVREQDHDGQFGPECEMLTE